MRTLCLLAVLVVARTLTVTLAGSELPVSAWTPVAFLWHDSMVVAGFAALELCFPRARLVWGAYGATVLFLALNVVLMKVLATTLTYPMLRATSTTLSDSMARYATPANMALLGAVLGAGILFPVLAGRVLPGRRGRPLVTVALACALPVVALGPVAVERLDTHGLHRNGVVTVVTSAFPRVVESPVPWDRASGGRRSVALPEPCDDLRFLSGAAAGRNVVLVLLESTGASYLRPYGSELDPMPNLSRRARNALIFEHAYTVYPESIKGLAAVLDSFAPAMDTQAGAYRRLAPRSLGHRFRQAGYHTALFHSGRFSYLGMESVVEGRGFELLADAASLSGVHDSSFGIDELSTVEHSLEWIDSLARDERFFLTYLPIAGHHPYDAPEPGPFTGDEDIDCYRNALHYADRAIERLIAGLEARGLAANTLFVLLGDHGQAFGQHDGNYGHVFHIYEENVRVPLLVLAPGLVEREIRITRPASGLDVAPTILSLLGWDPQPSFEGVSLLDPEPQMAFFMCDYSLAFLGLRDGPWKLIHHLESGRSSLYHLFDDPAEGIDVAERHQDLVAEYRRRLLAWSSRQQMLLPRSP